MLPTGPDAEVPGSFPPAPPGVDPVRFEATIAAIDEANAGDPTVLVVGGVARPKELAHAEAMTTWVLRLDPEADEAQLLAARAHHFRRWTYPRSAEAEGRSAYLRWRTEAKRRQAAGVAELLTSHGYDDELIEQVRALVAKEGLGRGGLADLDGRSPAVQTHEDALCLVFLTTQFEPVADQLGDDKMIDVLARTLAKMSDRGRAVAFALPLDDRAAALVVEAVERVSGSVSDDEPSDPGGLDLLLATPVDPLADGEGHDDPDLMGTAPVILVDSLPETPSDGGDVAPVPLPPLGLDPTSLAAGGHEGSEPVLDVATSSIDDDVAAGNVGHSEPTEPDPVSPQRASSVRRAMLWGERSHPPPVTAPPPPLPLDAPTSPTLGDRGAVEDRPASAGPPAATTARAPRPGEDPATTPDVNAEPARARRWFGRRSGGELASAAVDAAAPSSSEVPTSAPEAAATDDAMPMAEPIDLVVPAEPDVGGAPIDPWGLQVAVARLSAGARRAAAVPLGIASTMLVEGEVVEAVVQGEYQHHAAIVVLTSRRVVIVNERQWSPDVRVVPISAEVAVQGWQDDRRATLLVGHEGMGFMVSGIVDRPLARELARRLRELIASFGGPPA